MHQPRGRMLTIHMTVRSHAKYRTQWKAQLERVDFSTTSVVTDLSGTRSPAGPPRRPMLGR